MNYTGLYEYTDSNRRRKENPGMSVTNAAETLAAQVCRDFGINPQELVWIEHYGAESYAEFEREETWDRVTFAGPDKMEQGTLGHPQWMRLTEEEKRRYVKA